MKRYFFMMLCICGLAACHTYQSVTQTETGSFIQLNGGFRNAELIIDNQPAVLLDAKQKVFKLKGVEVIKFAVAQGAHHIQVIKQGKAIVDRKIFVSEGNTFEIIVP